MYLVACTLTLCFCCRILLSSHLAKLEKLPSENKFENEGLKEACPFLISMKLQVFRCHCKMYFLSPNQTFYHILTAQIL